MIKVGDKVLWRGNFGLELGEYARIVRMELCERDREKHGVPVEWISDDQKNRTVFDLDNGHWAYGEQIIQLSYDLEQLQRKAK